MNDQMNKDMLIVIFFEYWNYESFKIFFLLLDSPDFS